MVRNLCAGLLSLAFLHVGTSHASLIEFEIENGQLVGAKNLSVLGNLYDVEFVDGTCAQVYGTCETSSFTFQTNESAIDASQALLDKVFIDEFDSNSSLTFGCTNKVIVCDAYTPFFALQGDVFLQTSSAGNWNGSGDGVGNRVFFQTSDLSTNRIFVYARWTGPVVTQEVVQDVSEPSIMSLILLFGASLITRKHGRQPKRAMMISGV
jgi:hypothetical protein